MMCVLNAHVEVREQLCGLLSFHLHSWPENKIQIIVCGPE